MPFCPVTQGLDTGRSTFRSVKSAVGGATVSKGNLTDEFDPLTGVNVDSTPVLKPTLSDVRTTQHRILYTGGSAEMIGSLAPGERLSVEPDSLFNVDEMHVAKSLSRDREVVSPRGELKTPDSWISDTVDREVQLICRTGIESRPTSAVSAAPPEQFTLASSRNSRASTRASTRRSGRRSVQDDPLVELLSRIVTDSARREIEIRTETERACRLEYENVRLRRELAAAAGAERQHATSPALRVGPGETLYAGQPAQLLSAPVVSYAGAYTSSSYVGRQSLMSFDSSVLPTISMPLHVNASQSLMTSAVVDNTSLTSELTARAGPTGIVNTAVIDNTAIDFETQSRTKNSAIVPRRIVDLASGQVVGTVEINSVDNAQLNENVDEAPGIDQAPVLSGLSGNTVTSAVVDDSLTANVHSSEASILHNYFVNEAGDGVDKLKHTLLSLPVSVEQINASAVNTVNTDANLQSTYAAQVVPTPGTLSHLSSVGQMIGSSIDLRHQPGTPTASGYLRTGFRLLPTIPETDVAGLQTQTLTDDSSIGRPRPSRETLLLSYGHGPVLQSAVVSAPVFPHITPAVPTYQPSMSFQPADVNMYSAYSAGPSVHPIHPLTSSMPLGQYVNAATVLPPTPPVLAAPPTVYNYLGASTPLVTATTATTTVATPAVVHVPSTTSSVATPAAEWRPSLSVVDLLPPPLTGTLTDVATLPSIVSATTAADVSVSGTSTSTVTAVPAPPVTSSTAASATSSSAAAVTVASLPPTSATAAGPSVVVVRQLQSVRPYNGSTPWKLFRDHFYRVAKVNAWTSNEDLIQHLTLALEGPAAEVLRDFDDTSATALSDLWARLEHRFGDVDSAREALRKFEARRQSDSESLVEFEQALRTLYKEACPSSSGEHRDAVLKRRFQDGVFSTELSQYLRLHHRDLDFSQTVEKARIYYATMESTKSKKAVRFVAQADVNPELLPIVNQLKAIEGRLDKVFKEQVPAPSSAPAANQMPARQPTPPAPPPPPTSWRPRGPPPARQPQANNRVNGQVRRYGPQTQPSTPPPSPAPAPSTNRFQGPPTSGPPRVFVPRWRPRGRCFVCGQPGCHTVFHQQNQSTAGPPRVLPPRPGFGPPRGAQGCYVCDQIGCHSRLHDSGTRGPLPQRSSSVPPVPLSEGNGPRSPMSGDRAPPNSPRPQSR